MDGPLGLVIFENGSVYFEDSLIPDYEEEGHGEENEDNPQTPNEDQTYLGTVFTHRSKVKSY